MKNLYIQGLGIFPIAFGPRVDSERDSPFLPDDPAKLVSRKEFNSVPVIAGVTQNEGGYYAARNTSLDYILNKLNYNSSIVFSRHGVSRWECFESV